MSYGSYDLKFRNDTPHWILLKTVFTGWSLTVSLYSSPLRRRVVASTTTRTPLTDKVRFSVSGTV